MLQACMFIGMFCVCFFCIVVFATALSILNDKEDH